MLAGASVRPTSAWLLARPEAAVRCEATAGGSLRIQVEGPAPDEAVSVIAIEYEGDIEPIW